MMNYFFIYLFLGMIVGFFAGLLGIGGGIIIIPMLLFLFTHQGISPEIAIHIAIGTSLATIIITTSSSVIAHYKKNMIIFSLFKKMALGGVMGSIIGILIAIHIQGVYLQRMFGIFLLLIALQMIIKKEIQYDGTTIEPRKVILIIPVLLGILTSMLGLGGGVIMVPYLSWCRIPLRHAIATSTACILPIAIVASLGYMLTTPHIQSIPCSTGFIYWPALIGISLTGVFFAPIGARAAHVVNPKILRVIFSVFLVIVGFKMLF